MRVILAIIGALALAVIGAHIIGNDNGFVIVSFGEKVVRAKLSVFIIAVALASLLAYAILHLLYRLLTMPRRYRRWSTERRRNRSFSDLDTGLQALARGDFRRAERLLGNFRNTEMPAVSLLAAAQAAQALNSPGRRDGYLARARALMPDGNLAVTMSRAQILVEDGEYDAARDLLDGLNERDADNVQVMRLRYRIAEFTHNWDELLDLLPDLVNYNVISKSRAKALEKDLSLSLLRRSYPSLEAFDQVWARLPTHVRALEQSQLSYARQLIAMRQHEQAEQLVRKSLAHEWDSELASLYGEIRTENVSSQLAHAEEWHKHHEDDPGLLLSLGNLCVATERWDQAREYLEKLAQHDPSPLVFRLLAQTYDRLGDKSKAQESRERGLDLATGRESTALMRLPQQQPGSRETAA